MDSTIIQFLHQLNTQFYKEQGASFAQTRGAPWHGWNQCLEVLLLCHGDGSPGTQEAVEVCQENRPHGTLSVLDLACGNMRFADFLAEKLPDTAISYYGVDNSDEMSAKGTFLQSYQSLDIVQLLAGEGVVEVTKRLEAPPCELSVSFGFMHHIPGQSLRRQLLEAMIAHTNPGGYIIVSFWQFLNSPDLARKAEITHAQALADFAGLDTTPPLCGALEGGDYFLGWQGKPGAYRYCHSFSSAEIDQLIDEISDKAQLVARFDADGRTRNLNHYLVLKKTL